MITTLTKIKAFIYTYAELKTGEISVTTLEELKCFVEHAANSVILNIDNEILVIKEEKERAFYTEQLQLTITGLINDLSDSDPGAPEISDIFNWLQLKLINLLEHLHRYFGKYFSNSVPIPPAFVTEQKSKSFNRSMEMIAWFRKLVKDDELNQLFSNFLLSSDAHDRFFMRSWNQWLFYKNFIDEFTFFLGKPPAGDPRVEVMKLFIEINFNCIYVYSYFLKFMELLSADDAEDEAVEHELFYLLKVFRQINIRDQIGFDLSSKPLQELIQGSITAELKYIAQKNKLFHKAYKVGDDSASSRFYFTVMVTLAEIMFLFRVMIETEFIVTKMRSHLYEFISKHIRTKRAENLSKKSMRNRFGSNPFSDRIVRNIREWLLKMVQHIDLHYK